MREIKFRAWDTKTNKMFPVCNIHTNHAGVKAVRIVGKVPPAAHSAYGTPNDRLVASRIELMQFTGLLDKNGREVFEGDIVAPNCVIEWSPKMLAFVTKLDVMPNLELLLEGMKLEVIGNIYDNPELLK